MREQVIGLGTLFLVLSGIFLRSAAKTVITMGVLWLTGTLWPYVAHALGIPQQTLYDFIRTLIESIGHLLPNL